MLIRNNQAKVIKFILDNKEYIWNPSEEKDIPSKSAKMILALQPELSLVEKETEIIHSEPQKIEAKNVVKNKKSRK